MISENVLELIASVMQTLQILATAKLKKWSNVIRLSECSWTGFTVHPTSSCADVPWRYYVTFLKKHLKEFLLIF